MKLFIVVFIIWSCCCFATNEEPRKIIIIKTKSITENIVSGVHLFKIKNEIQNISSQASVREIMLDAIIYNKDNDVIASKLVAVNWEKRKPFIKRSFIEKIKNTFNKLNTDDTLRKKLENANVLKPTETKEFEIFFYDDDFKSSVNKDKTPVSYSVKFHSAKIVEPN